jgi:hypothetical protein
MEFLCIIGVLVAYFVSLYFHESRMKMIEDNYDDVWNDLVGDDDWADDVDIATASVKY